ncbi:MAG: serine/threonine protein kinase [Deltaproteobacteria bacterium]|nr:serine/threonine protein kinase [Deltaproteobacteria bacterium]
MPQQATAEIDSSTGVASSPLRIGRYLLFDSIAAGGMATVHLGRLIGSSGFSRVVAIKRLHGHLTQDPSFVSMLLDEARLVARVRHPNVVPVLDVADLPGELCLVMEYVDGEPVSSLVRAQSARGVPMPLPVAASIMVGALMGLHAAHDATSESGAALGIVHRDVSPQNIMVGRDGLSRVLDFGIAYAAERIQVTRDGQIKGKLAYMAPEQVMGSKVDRRTDVYAAGVVCWELLTGRRLFAGENTAHTMRLITDGTPMPPSQVVSTLSPEIDALVMRALSKDAAQRFATAADMSTAIESATDLASQQEVSRWVNDIAGASLAARAAKVVRIEQYVDDAEQRAVSVRQPLSPAVEALAVPIGSSQVTDLATPDGLDALRSPSRSKKLWMAGLGAIGVVAVAAAFGAAALRTSPLPTQPSAVASRPELAASSAEPAVSSSPVAAPSTAPEVIASASAPTSTARKPGPLPPPPRPKGCNPPWTVDKDGVRVPKKDCF